MPDTATQLQTRINNTLDHYQTAADQIIASARDGLITRTEAASLLTARFDDTLRWLSLHEAHLELARAHDNLPRPPAQATPPAPPGP
jgi:hypothetical protein